MPLMVFVPARTLLVHSNSLIPWAYVSDAVLLAIYRRSNVTIVVQLESAFIETWRDAPTKATQVMNAALVLLQLVIQL